MVWSSSTAGVERRFSVADPFWQTPASQVQERCMSLQVAFDEGSLQEKEAAKREFFAQGYPRNTGRLDKGTKWERNRKQRSG